MRDSCIRSFLKDVCPSKNSWLQPPLNAAILMQDGLLQSSSGIVGAALAHVASNRAESAPQSFPALHVQQGRGRPQYAMYDVWVAGHGYCGEVVMQMSVLPFRSCLHPSSGSFQPLPDLIRTCRFACSDPSGHVAIDQLCAEICRPVLSDARLASAGSAPLLMLEQCTVSHGVQPSIACAS